MPGWCPILRHGKPPQVQHDDAKWLLCASFRPNIVMAGHEIVMYRTGVTMELIIRKSPLPWASVHWLVQWTLECHWLAQCTLGYHWATQRILAGYTGTPLEKLSWNSPTLECHWGNLVETALHWDATGETLTIAAYTGTPLQGLWQPTHAPTHSKACRIASMPVWNDKMAGHQ